MHEKPILSIVVPVYNEEENVRPLFEKIQAVCEAMGVAYEVLFVDDGSSDETFAALSALSETAPRLRVLRFAENAGQTAAMAAGFRYATGERIVSLDGDLQNDPADIPKLLEKLDAGYDIVCGWRKARQDTFLTRRVPSVVANWIIAKVTGVPIHDNGCSLKAYRASVIKQVPLYGEMHRFIPAMAKVVGAETAEIVVTHHPRRFGESKYGLGRVWRVMVDIIAFRCILAVFAEPPKRRENSLRHRIGNVLFKRKQRALRLAAFLALPLFISGRLLIGEANGAAVCCFGAAIAALLFGWLTERSIRRARKSDASFGSDPLARFFLRRFRQRPLRFFGPIGGALVLLGALIFPLLSGAPWTEQINLNVLFLTSGLAVFCVGLFGELITFANAEQIKSYTLGAAVNITLDR